MLQVRGLCIARCAYLHLSFRW